MVGRVNIDGRLPVVRKPDDFYASLFRPFGESSEAGK
jgi:hypothetical protein